MTAVTGQASVEYAGLLGLAAVLGAALALVAGPPLLGAVRNAFVAALSGRAHSPAPVVAGAADIADIQSALLPTADGLTPDAALLALGQRHSDEDAHDLADSLLLAAARATAPWLGEAHTYRAWIRPQDGPYESIAGDARGDHDIESASGPPVVAWVTMAAQRHALAAALAHHTNRVDLGLDLIGLVPFGKLVRWSVDAVAHPVATGWWRRCQRHSSTTATSQTPLRSSTRTTEAYPRACEPAMSSSAGLSIAPTGERDGATRPPRVRRAWP